MPLPIRLSSAAAMLAAGWFIFCAVPRTALAEVVLLKSGAKVEGEILNPARSKDDLVEVVPVEGLKLTLAASQVKGVLVQSKVLKDYEAAVAKMADTLDAHLAMAQWCLEASLAEQRKFHLSQVIKHDPNHAMARATLGYIKVGSGWMTQNEYMRRQGYVLKGGAYRLAQELETTERAGQWERDTLAARKNLKMWFSWLNGKGKGADQALENIRGIREEAAAPALSEAVADTRLPRDLRLMCLDVLTQFPPNYYGTALIKIAMKDPDPEMSDKCLDVLREQRSQQALLTFVKGLTSKDNRVVNRSAQCAQRLGDPAATVPLIDALVTTHEFIIQSGQPGQMSAGFSGNDGGLGSFSMGEKPKKISRHLNNDAVLNALTSLHQGVNFNFNEPAWRAWYIESHTSPDVNLRRGE
ncbi:MAG: HEAT repeat domain-containing protein [Pirellulaceae bacterium]